MTIYQDIHQSWAVDCCNWNETIRVHFSDVLKEHIIQARLMLQQNAFIDSIDMVVPSDFIHEEDVKKLQEQCRYDINKLAVFKNGLYWEIQSEWDASYQAEYDVTHLMLAQE